MVLEDDYGGDLNFDRVPGPALRSSNGTENDVYMGTFSKVQFIIVRLGYPVADAPLIQQMASLHWSLFRGIIGLLQQ